MGKTWTRILRIIRSAMLITTEGVAAAIFPPAGDTLVRSKAHRATNPPDGLIFPSKRSMILASTTLGKMQAVGLVRRATPGKLWALDEGGSAVLAAADSPVRRSYKTTLGHRKIARARRAAAAALDRCINENIRGTHGLATHGCRCHPCHETHRKSA